MARGKKFAADQIIPNLCEAELVISQGDSTQTAWVGNATGVSFTHLLVRRVVKGPLRVPALSGCTRLSGLAS